MGTKRNAQGIGLARLESCSKSGVSVNAIAGIFA
jgi:hypothetical protein